MENNNSYNRPTSNEKEYRHKVDVLIYETAKKRPEISEFRGKEGFPKDMLRRDQDYVNRKDREYYTGKKDIFAEAAEPIFAYLLNSSGILPGRRNWAFISCEYDDYANGTDIVLGIEGANTRSICSVDVATGTSERIKDKINSGFEKDRSKLGLDYGHSRIKYCKHNGDYWTEKNTPHFVIGASPRTIDKTINSIRLEEDRLEGIEDIRELTFKTISEMFEELPLVENLGGREYFFRNAFIRSFQKYFEKEEITNEEYNREIVHLAATDETYRLIINEVRKAKLAKNRARKRKRGVNAITSTER